MMTRAMLLGFIFAACLSATPVAADTPVAAPYGWMMLCTGNPSFCERHEPASAPLSSMKLIVRVNRAVNDEIEDEPLDSPAQKIAENQAWRVVMPGGLGVCVEYALNKELVLATMGVPQGAMRLAQVHRAQDPDDISHLVVLIRIQGVEMVLDSLTPVIDAADAERWDWLAVQDDQRLDPLAWMKPDGAPK